MKVCCRADYCKFTKTGVIRISKIVGRTPVEYAMTLYDIKQGVLKTKKYTFPTAELAMGHAGLYGFLVQDWKTEETEV